MWEQISNDALRVVAETRALAIAAAVADAMSQALNEAAAGVTERAVRASGGYRAEAEDAARQAVDSALDAAWASLTPEQLERAETRAIVTSVVLDMVDSASVATALEYIAALERSSIAAPPLSAALPRLDTARQRDDAATGAFGLQSPSETEAPLPSVSPTTLSSMTDDIESSDGYMHAPVSDASGDEAERMRRRSQHNIKTMLTEASSAADGAEARSGGWHGAARGERTDSNLRISTLANIAVMRHRSMSFRERLAALHPMRLIESFRQRRTGSTRSLGTV